MSVHVRALVFFAVSIAIAGLVAACGGNSDSKATASATAAPTGSATPGVTATSSLGIRTLDLGAVADVRALEASTGGAYVQTSAIYADLTGDGIDEAVVPISSGGTLGDVAFVVLSPSDGATKTLLKVAPTDGAGGLSVAVAAGVLVMTRPVYGPDDPNCCPSALRKTTYAWNGSTFIEQSVTTEANPAGGAKQTAVPAATP